MSTAHFVYIADIYCPWCYAFGPVMQRIAAQHPEFPVHVLGGDLMAKPVTLAEDAAHSPGLTDFWHEVEHASGRSLAGAIRAVETGSGMQLFSPGADRVLETLKALAPGHALEQLLALEELFYGQGEDIFSEHSLAALAQRWHIAPDALKASMASPETAQAAQRGLEEAAALMGEISAYPSVILVRGSRRDAVSRGFVHYETVAARLEDAMRDLGLEEMPAHTVCSWHGGCTLGRHTK